MKHVTQWARSREAGLGLPSRITIEGNWFQFWVYTAFTVKRLEKYYSKPSLIRLYLIGMSDNSDPVWKIKHSVRTWVHTLKYTWTLGARGISDCVEDSWRDWNHAKKISKIGLSWMKETLDFSLWQKKKLLSPAMPMLLYFPFICFLCFVFLIVWLSLLQ
jgi:hypothetical protein